MIMNRKVILFDIDRTLFDADLFEEMIYQEISKATGLKNERINEMRMEFRSKIAGYLVNDLIDYISQKSKVNLDFLKKKLNDKNTHKEYIFNEVETVLNNLSKNNFLGIFSNGYYDYQIKKISSIVSFFKKDLVFITDGKLENNFLKKIPEGSVIIEDDKDIVKNLRNLNIFNVIWLNRKNNKEKIDGVIEIKNLNELKNFI